MILQYLEKHQKNQNSFNGTTAYPNLTSSVVEIPSAKLQDFQTKILSRIYVTSTLMIQYSLLIVFTVLLFNYEFFPLTNNIRKYDNEVPTKIENIPINPSESYSSDIENVVLIVIDALRLDFVQDHLLPYATNAAKELGCFSQVTVEAPTVTLPRIKALTTGSVPQFIDIITNLITAEILEDSLIHSFKRHNKNIVFYGDEVWQKLFAKRFLRSEPTTSFFVTDFTEVDSNVTRNVNLELTNTDWDVMILHYLGLDHIGHVHGPRSALVPTKLQEMDDVIKNIHQELKKRGKKFLIMVTGDHGMRDTGGHGGTTYPETVVPLLVLGTDCRDDSFDQTDVAVNVAALLGLKIPYTSIGQIHRSFINSVSTGHHLFALRYNLELLRRKSRVCSDELWSKATNFHLNFIETNDSLSAEQAMRIYGECSKAVSESLRELSVSHGIDVLLVALAVLLSLLFILLRKVLVPDHSFDKLEFSVLFGIVIAHFFVTNYVTVILSSVTASYFTVKNIWGLVKLWLSSGGFRCFESIQGFMIFLTILQPVAFLSSSYIEEEHQIWYFLFVFGTLLTMNYSLTLPYMLQVFLIPLTFRFIRTINQTGIQEITNLNAVYTSEWLQKSENVFYLFAICFLGLFGTWFGSNFLSPSKPVEKILTFITFISIFIFKNWYSTSALFGQCIWLLIAVHFLVYGRKNLLNTWSLIAALLLKHYNVVLVPFCLFSSHIFLQVRRSRTVSALFHLWLGNVLYFAQGHSNSIASVDISVGYIGLSSYEPVWVFLQVLMHTYCFPILCNILLFSSLKSGTYNVWLILFIQKLFVTLITCIITLKHRYHLFIWSVFAPKLFMDSSHIIVLFLEMMLMYFYKLLTKCIIFMKKRII